LSQIGQEQSRLPPKKGKFAFLAQSDPVMVYYIKFVTNS
jgi:hypothetical protein